MELINAVIVDDEAGSRTALRSELSAIDSKVDVVAEADGVATAIATINEHQPQLVFLDIQMGDGTGFDVLKQLDKIDFQLIFVTAFDQYAVQAFRFSAIDYLLKPIDVEDLTAAIAKVRKNLETGMRQSIQTLLQNYASPARRKVVLYTSEGAHVFKTEDVVRIEADGNYCKVYPAIGKMLYVARTLKEFEEMLGPSAFIRTHQSHLVNFDHVKTYVNKDGGYLILKDDTTVPIAQRKKSVVLAALEEL